MEIFISWWAWGQHHQKAAPSIKQAVRSLVIDDQNGDVGHIQVVSQRGSREPVVLMDVFEVGRAMSAFRDAHSLRGILSEGERQASGMRQWQDFCQRAAQLEHDGQ